MTANGWLQILLFLGAIAAITRPAGGSWRGCSPASGPGSTGAAAGRAADLPA